MPTMIAGRHDRLPVHRHCDGERGVRPADRRLARDRHRGQARAREPPHAVDDERVDGDDERHESEDRGARLGDLAQLRDTAPMTRKNRCKREVGQHGRPREASRTTRELRDEERERRQPHDLRHAGEARRDESRRQPQNPKRQRREDGELRDVHRRRGPVASRVLADLRPRSCPIRFRAIEASQPRGHHDLRDHPRHRRQVVRDGGAREQSGGDFEALSDGDEVHSAPDERTGEGSAELPRLGANPRLEQKARDERAYEAAERGEPVGEDERSSRTAQIAEPRAEDHQDDRVRHPVVEDAVVDGRAVGQQAGVREGDPEEGTQTRRRDLLDRDESRLEPPREDDEEKEHGEERRGVCDHVRSRCSVAGRKRKRRDPSSCEQDRLSRLSAPRRAAAGAPRSS